MNDATLHCQLATLCLKIDATADNEIRNRLADEAESIARKLGIPVPDRALLGKPAEQHQLEV